MKKAKIISIMVIMLSVIALGVFMGKQMFKLLEADSSTALKPPIANETDTSVKILYTADKLTDDSQQRSDRILPELIVTNVDMTKSANTKPKNEAIVSEKPYSEFDYISSNWFAYALVKGVNVREDATISSKNLFKVAKGTKGTVLSKKNGWTKIKWDFNKKIGWVRDDLLVQGPASIMTTLVSKSDDIAALDISSIKKATAKQALENKNIAVAIAKPAPISETVNTFVNTEKLPEKASIVPNMANIRSNPGTDNSIVTKLPKGMIVGIKKVNKIGKWNWFEITFNNGRKSGWTREDNLKF